MGVYDKGLVTVPVCNIIYCLASTPFILRKVLRNPVYGYRMRMMPSNDKIRYEVNAYFAWRFLATGVL